MNKSIISCVLIACILGIMCGCKHNNSADVLVSGGRPEGDKLLNIIIPSEEDAEAHIELAYYLYDNANKLDQLCEKRIATSFCPVSVAVTIDTYVYDIKNKDEFLFLEYHIARSDGGKLLSALVKDLVYGTRSYYKLGREKMIEQTVKNASIEGGVPCSNWEDNPVITYAEPPYFHASQELSYEKTGIVIRPETISSAKVEYEEEQGFYKIHMVLDVNNPLTTSRTIESLRSGGAGAAADYTSIVEYIEIWDNGYFKFFLSTDKWESRLLKAVLPYQTTYSYYDKDCDIHSFKEVEGLLDLIDNEN